MNQVRSLLKSTLILVSLLTGLLTFNAYAISYTYDNIGRLTHVSYDNGAYISYFYDEVGNITQMTSQPALLDSDNDGLPDSWETANGLGLLDPNDALLDADGDGYTNLEEYQANSDPQDDQSIPDEISPALDTHRHDWILSGDVQWFAQDTTYQVGDSALQSGAIVDSEQSSIETTVSGTTSISFYWKVFSEAGHDALIFYIDDVEIALIDGEVDWHQMNFKLAPGTHTLRWTYLKNGTISDGSDAGWLDGVSTNSGLMIPLLFLLL